MPPSFILQILIAVVLLSAVLYGVSCNLVREKSDAQHVADTFYAHLQHRDWNSAAALYDPDFFAENGTDPQQWASKQESILAVLGEFQECKVVSWTERKETEVGEPGQFYQLNYVVSYVNDSVSETFILKKAEGQETIRILSRSVNPARLFVEPTL